MDPITRLKSHHRSISTDAFAECRRRPTPENREKAKWLRNNLLRRLHPDRGGDAELCVLVTDAYAYAISGRRMSTSDPVPAGKGLSRAARPLFVFACDTSPSMGYTLSTSRVTDGRSRLAAVKTAAIELAKAFATQSPNASLGLLGFSTEARWYTGGPLNVRTKHSDWRDAVESLSIVGRSTNITDAVLVSLSMFTDVVREYPDRHLLVLSDGFHTDGRPYPVDAAERLKATGVTIHTRGFAASQSDAEFDEQTLIQMASVDCNGKRLYRFHSDGDTLAKDFRALPQQLLLLESGSGGNHRGVSGVARRTLRDVRRLFTSK